MSFNINYFSKIANPGTPGGNSVWYYHDYAADNVASLVGTAGNITYFGTAYTLYGIQAKAGDLIMVSSFATKATNTASPVMGLVPNSWDANGSTVLLTAWRFS